MALLPRLLPLAVTSSAGDVVSFGALLQGGAAVFLIRRLRAAVAAAAASGKPPVRLVCVAKETLGREEFVQKYWPAPLELFFDAPGTPLFKACNGKSQGVLSGFGSYLLGGAVAAAAKSAKDKGVEGNMEGEGLALGAVLVVSGKGELLLHHLEKTWGDHPPEDALAEALRGV